MPINLHHAGKYPDLQTVAPGAKWTESFWVRRAASKIANSKSPRYDGTWLVPQLILRKT